MNFERLKLVTAAVLMAIGVQAKSQQQYGVDTSACSIVQPSPECEDNFLVQFPLEETKPFTYIQLSASPQETVYVLSDATYTALSEAWDSYVACRDGSDMAACSSGKAVQYASLLIGTLTALDTFGKHWQLIGRVLVVTSSSPVMEDADGDYMAWEFRPRKATCSLTPSTNDEEWIPVYNDGPPGDTR